MPKISVIVPVYKVEEYLRRCVDSILNQTFQDFELILVDDGSPDNCPQICDEYAKKDNRVFVIHKENGGLSDARNKGIDWAFENSDSEWITFIDSDDWVHEQYLESLYKGVIENNCEISSCGYIETKGEIPEGKEGEIKVLSPEDFWLMPNSNAVIAWSKLYKKVLWKGYRFPKGKIHEDEFTTHKVLFSVDKICKIENELYYYFYNENGITKSAWNPKRMVVFKALKNHILFFRKKKIRRIYISSYKRLIQRYIKHIELATDSQEGNEYSKEIKCLRRGLGRNLIKFRKHMPIRHYDDVYLIAYPKRKKLIKFLKRLDSKVSRMFHKGQEV